MSGILDWDAQTKKKITPVILDFSKRCRQSDAFDKILITGIAVQGIQIWILLNTDKQRHMVVVSFFQPLKNFIVLSESRIRRREF
jgi:hypothetical protein